MSIEIHNSFITIEKLNYIPMNVKSIFLMICCALSVAFVQAQTRVSGIVYSDEKEPLPGVIVSVKNTNTKVSTDQSGKFTINTKSKADVLVFSYIGFKTLSLPVQNKTSFNVVLEKELNNLNEIIVIGYGEVKQKDLTGAVGKVNLEDMLKAPVGRFDEALGGRVAGVSVVSSEGMPGSEMNIVIRGNNSVTQQNSPLYVIDGFPSEESASNVINPSDIESYTILKDASATAIYGARAANGVVVITTKKGKIGAARVSYDGNYSISKVTKKIPLLNAYEFVKLQSESFTAADFAARYLAGNEKSLEDYRNVRTVDWQDLIFRTAGTQNHNVNVSGGNPQTRYSVSLSAFDQDGTIINSNYSRYQGRINLNQKISEKFRFDINSNFARFTQTGESPSQVLYSNSANLLRNVWSYRPLASVNNVDLINDLIDESISSSSDLRINPLDIVNNEYKKRFNDDIRINSNLEYSIIRGLKLKVSGGISNLASRYDQFNNTRTRSGNLYRQDGVNASVENRKNFSWLNENTLTYNSAFDVKKEHVFDVMIGETLQGGNTNYLYQRVVKIPNEALGMSGMSQGDTQKTTAINTEWRLLSFLSRFNYNYKSKYYFTATVRADGSSKFPKDIRWGYFPSLALGWNMHEESFLKNVKSISSAKLRGSWGQTGNNRIPDYSYWAQMRSLISRDGDTYSSEYVFNDANATGYAITSPGNEKLKWETTTQTDIGLDLSLFDQKLSFTADVYKKVTDGLLLNANLPPSFGFSSSLMNIGKVSNKGLELTLESQNIKTKSFKWNSSFNISFNKNEVVALSRNEESLVSVISYSNAYIARIGQPLGLMYGYVYEGTYKYDDFDLMPDGKYVLKSNLPNNGTDRNGILPGDIRFKDINGDGIVNNTDATMIGRGIPIHTGGFSNNFQYKGFDLNIFFQWSYGNNIYNSDKMFFARGKPEVNYNRFATYADRWTPENPNSDIPRVGGWGTGVFSSYEIEDGSFLRLKTVALGYTFSNAIAKKLSARKIRVYASGQNLITWTNYSGYDPEVSTKNTALTPGFDGSSYPRAYVLNVGLNFIF
jgi:TonB-linked SusC/RagA family outer membrane protein